MNWVARVTVSMHFYMGWNRLLGSWVRDQEKASQRIDASAGVRYAGVSASIMLKIGTVRWRGKCAKHPGFDPAMDGPGAIKGNCQRCNDLVVIHDLHQKALRLMRTFRPMDEKKTLLKPGGDDRQMGLFA